MTLVLSLQEKCTEFLAGGGKIENTGGKLASSFGPAELDALLTKAPPKKPVADAFLCTVCGQTFNTNELAELCKLSHPFDVSEKVDSQPEPDALGVRVGEDSGDESSDDVELVEPHLIKQIVVNEESGKAHLTKLVFSSDFLADPSALPGQAQCGAKSAKLMRFEGEELFSAAYKARACERCFPPKPECCVDFPCGKICQFHQSGYGICSARCYKDCLSDNPSSGTDVPGHLCLYHYFAAQKAAKP